MSAHTYSQTLHDVDAYAASLADLVVSSPTSYHAVATAGARLDAVGFSQVDEKRTWNEVPTRGYVLRDGAIIAWMLPDSPGQHTGLRILGAHTDSPALKLKPTAAVTSHGFQLINAEVYGGPLLNSFLDRELGLAGRLVTRDGEVHLVRTGPVARVAQVAPHLDRGSMTPSTSTRRPTSCRCGPSWTTPQARPRASVAPPLPT